MLCSGGERSFVLLAHPPQGLRAQSCGGAQPRRGESLNISAETSRLLEHATVIPLRLRPGDESSCLNLYRPTRPRILGATSAMIERGGFQFAALPSDFDTIGRNPWELLESPLSGGVIPVFGDEAAVRWQLHLGIGKELMIQDERGRERVLRFVGLLKGSMLQDELIVSDAQFAQMFPSIR